MSKRRFELSASGIDDGFQGISTDPFPTSAPQASGLRIPPVLSSSDASPSTRVRYLFCLATRAITKPTRLIGMRQGLTIGIDLNNGTAPMKPLELFVTTPNFTFPDGNVSWHLVAEPNFKPVNQRPITDTNNWAYRWSQSPAMLYETFTNSTITPTGAPVLYMRGLTAYVPPDPQGMFKPVEEDLFCFRDIRFRQDSDHAWDSLNIEFGQNDRVSLYASVLQTNPVTRESIVSSPAPFGTPPEQAFITAFTSGGEGGPFGPIFWRVFGSLIFEDEI